MPTIVNVLYSFSPATNYVPFLGYTNSEGAFCTSALVQDDNDKLYGVAPGGGDFGGGTVFSLNTNGTDFKVLHTFTQVTEIFHLPNDGYYQYNIDGNSPAGLTLGLDGKLYGTASLGGTNGYGAVFALNIDGTEFTNLHSFTATDGEYPQSRLVQGPDGTFYGTAKGGGTNGYGTVFSLRPDGSAFTVLYSFTPLISNTNSDGTQPHGGLILSSDGLLYGTTRYGGPGGSSRPNQLPAGSGTIFCLGTNGTGFKVLHAFDEFFYGFLNPTNTDGASPRAALLLGNDGKLYGSAPEAGPGSAGTIFCVCTNGNNYTVLQTFNERPLPPDFYSIAYGLYPYGGLIRGNDGILYGAAYGGGLTSNDGYLAGTLYRLNLDGSDLSLLHSFAGVDGYNDTNADGANPFMTLLKSGDGKFYGLTSAGGINGSGTIFSFTPPVVLQVAISNDLVVLSWPATATNFVLETGSALSSGSAWTTLTNSHDTKDNRYIVPRSENDLPVFFRLHQQQ